jgi:hypothetical protein
MHWCMKNLPAIGHDESWIKDNVDNFHRIYIFVKYIDGQLCLSDDQGVRPDLNMAVLQRFDSNNYRKLLARSGGRFHAEFSRHGNFSRLVCVKNVKITMAILSHLMTLVPTMGFRTYGKFSRVLCLTFVNVTLTLTILSHLISEGMAMPKILRLLRRTSLTTKITITTLVPTMGFRTLYQQLLLLAENWLVLTVTLS